MRKIILISLMMALCAFSYAQSLSITNDFTYANTTFSKIASGSYNFVTDHFYACDYDDATEPVSILNSDGTEQSPTQGLNISGLTMGGLNVFSMATDSAGVIYGGTDTAPDGTLIRWATESSVPTGQVITGFLFPRVMDLSGTGVDTVIAVTGNADNAPAQILTTSDGATFAIAETTQGLADCKQGIAVNVDGTIIYGSQAYNTVPRKWVPSGTPGTWNEETTFAPDNAEIFAPLALDYWDEEDVLFGLSTRRTTEEIIVGIDGTDGSLLDASDPIGQDITTSGYGSIELELSGISGEGRYIQRDAGASGYVCGKFSFIMATPTPTPIVEAANSVWGLYE